jgi:RNA polymerase sigma factor (sigma-70 family)
MPSRQELEALFLANLPAAEKILSALARRHALSRDQSEEFAAWAKLQLIKNDYAILGKFRGESALTTYLNVVLSMLYREYRVQEWGRWRASAAAKRGGPLAVRFEALIYRDGMPLSQAGELLRTSGATSLSDRELGEILRDLPRRSPARPVELTETSVDTEATQRADDLVEEQQTTTELLAARNALDSALRELSDEDRLIVRLHFLENITVADIARGLALPQKSLYRRLERAIKTLRTGLERAGVSLESIRALLRNIR